MAGLPFSVELAGTSYCDGTYCIRRQRSPVTVVEYVVSGTGTLQIGGEQYAAGAGDVYILPAGSDHVYYADARNPWIKHFFNARGELILHLLADYGLQGRTVFHTPAARLLFEDFLVLCTGGAAPADRCALKMHEILLCLAAGQEDVPAGEAQQLKAYLDSHLESTVTIQELADSIYRSRDYVTKLFRREYGITPYAYLIGRKMDMARALLADTRLSVREIAQRLGYDDQQYFSNVFRRAAGLSPLGYRKQRREER